MARPPMNQLDLSATPMRACLLDAPDAAPCACMPNRIKLDELASNEAGSSAAGRRSELASSTLDFSDADRADEDTLNRALWNSTRGEEPHPAAFSARAMQRMRRTTSGDSTYFLEVLT